MRGMVEINLEHESFIKYLKRNYVNKVKYKYLMLAQQTKTIEMFISTQ